MICQEAVGPVELISKVLGLHRAAQIFVVVDHRSGRVEHSPVEILKHGFASNGVGFTFIAVAVGKVTIRFTEFLGKSSVAGVVIEALSVLRVQLAALSAVGTTSKDVRIVSFLMRNSLSRRLIHHIHRIDVPHRERRVLAIVSRLISSSLGWLCLQLSLSG